MKYRNPLWVRALGWLCGALVVIFVVGHVVLAVLGINIDGQVMR